MATFIYPSSADLTLIAQDKVPLLTQADPLFDIMPIETQDTTHIIWEQLDNYTGLQSLRGMNSDFPIIGQLGSKQYVETPGIYGEGSLIDEFMLMERRRLGTFNAPVDVNDLVMQKQDRLLQRRIDRIRYIGWTLLTTGTFSVSTKNGTIAHVGYYKTQTYTASVSWSTFATATPLADLRAVQLLARGHSVNLGSNAVAYANRKTVNNMLNNLNSADIYGRRVAGLATANSLQGMNAIFMMDDLPTLVVYDDGYLADGTGLFTPFIPDNTVVVVGKRTVGDPIAKYVMTRNAVNPSLAPGPYMYVDDARNDGGQAPSIGIFDSHAGGPIILYPSAIVVMSV